MEMIELYVQSDGKDFFLMEKPLTGNCVVFFPFQFDHFV